MARVLLGVTGSVAAVRTPELVASLVGGGHALRLASTKAAAYFFDPSEIGEDVTVESDEDEWPGRHYQRGDPVLHIELRNWADVLVVAPLDAHTLAKFALGLSDNLLTCVYRAWDFARPVVLAPAMNTRMWDSPVTRRHLRQLLDDRGDGRHGDAWRLEEAAEVFARHAPGIVLVPPQSKRLACGDVGLGAMAEVSAIAEAVRRWGQESAA
jgi:phosphopantothenoylcysteine decarboxylase